jgi:hypothetical protein
MSNDEYDNTQADRDALLEFVLWPAEAEEQGLTGPAAEKYVELRKKGQTARMAGMLASGLGPAGVVRGSSHPCPKTKA